MQREVALNLETRLPDEYRWFHVANERGGRSKVENAILSALGLKAGVADVIILHMSGRVAAWIELKVGKNKPTKPQLDWINWLNAGGAPCACACWSLEEVEDALGKAGVELAPRDRPFRLPPPAMMKGPR